MAVPRNGLEDLGEAAPQSGEVTGVIRPPPDIRAIVDKTAQFVAQHGKSFESRILSSDAGQSQKFAFMKPTDPYHAYYELRIRECEENGGQLPQEEQSKPVVVEEKKEVVASSQATTVVEKKASATAPIARVLQGVDTTEPPPKLLSSTTVASAGLSLTPAQKEIVLLTAQYTAASGRQFLAGLAQREQRNPQFDFLKPTHVLFSYFTSLVDEYTKVVAPSPELRAELELCTSEEYCLRRCARRWDWTRREEDVKRREKAQNDAERVAFQAVDWHDFVVVDTIDFPDAAEDAAQQENYSTTTPALNQQQLSNEEGTLPSPTVPTPTPQLPDDDQIKIVSEYAPRVASASDRQGPRAMIDPLTGNEVPIDRMSEHMRIQLLDPKWREEQKKLASSLADGGNSTLAAGDQIVHTLSAFAKQRNDIFGSTEDEQAALLEESRLANNKADDEHGRIIWDGHGSSINKVHAKVLGSLNSDSPGTAAPTVPGYEPPLLGAPPGLGAHVAANPPPPLPPPPPPPSRDAYVPPPSFNTAPPPQLNQAPAASHSSPPIPSLPPPPPPPQTAAPQQLRAPAATYSSPPVPPAAPSTQMPAMAFPPPPPLQPQQLQQQGYFQSAAAAIPPGMVAGIVPPTPAATRPDGEPELKRPRVDLETGLVSESDFAQLVGDAPQSISIKTPVDDSNASWGLKGQIVTVECKVTDTIRTVKQKVSSHLGNMPAGKQQLRSPTLGFLKDALTLAHFNIKGGDAVELKVRRR